MRSWRSRQTRVVKGQRRQRRLVFILIIILVAAFGVFYALFLSGWLAATRVEIINAHFAQAQQLERGAEQYLFSQKILGFINFRNNFIFLSAKDFNGLLLKDPAVKDFSLTKSLKSKSLIFHLEERQEKGILCLAGEEQSCFYFDDQGIVFAASPQTEGNVIFLIKDASGRLYNLGDRILALGSFSDLVAIWDNLATHFHLDNVQVTATDLIIRSSAGWQIYLNPGDLARIKVAVQNLLQSDFNFGSLEYLDLRYLPNIYWKPVL